MADDFGVRVSAGSLRGAGAAYVVPHDWTTDGVVVAGGGTGAHALHTAVALCVLNDVYREGRAAGIGVDGVSVVARGGFDEDWSSTGISYAVEVDSPEDESRVSELLDRVDQVAEIPRAVRSGATVTRDG